MRSVSVERRKAQSPWIEFTWRAASVLAGRPDAVPWTRLSEDQEAATFYAGAAEIELYRSETANYRDNLSTGVPLRAATTTLPISSAFWNSPIPRMRYCWRPCST